MAGDVNLLTVKSLEVRRGELLLCRGVDFDLAVGEICHIAGVNGAGKTTLLMQLARLIPSIGIDWRGNDLVYVGYELGLAEMLTVKQNWQFLLGLYGLTLGEDSLQETLSVVGLSGYEKALVGQLSSGQKRRASLARLWLIPTHIAPIWLLDEPLTALDVSMTKVLTKKLQAFVCSGGAVMLTSHQPLAIVSRCIDLGDYTTEDDGAEDDA